MVDNTHREMISDLDPAGSDNPVATLYSLAAKGPHAAGTVSRITLLLRNKLQSVRAAAAHALSRIRAHPEIAVPALVALLKAGPRLADSSRTIELLPWTGAKPRRDRCEAIYALGAFGPEASDAASTLAKLLRDQRPEETPLAAAALGELGGAGVEVRRTLLRIVTQEKVRARRYFWFHLNKENTARALWQARKAAARACGRLGIVEAADPLLHKITKNEYNEMREFLPYRWNNEFRQAAAFALADLCVAGGKRAPQRGNSMWKGDAPNLPREKGLRIPSISGADPGNEAIRSALLTLLDDPCRNLQWSAAMALRQIGHEAPFPLDEVLEFALAPNPDDLREEGLTEITLQNLWRLGAKGRRAVPRLLKRLHPTSRQIQAIVESLALLAPDDPEVRGALADVLSARSWTWDVDLDNRAFAVLRALALDSLTSRRPLG